MFKVVPDQLRISDGWVRCGQCDEVFDANANLFSEPAEQEPEQPQEPLTSREPVAPISPDPDWAASLRFASEEHTEAREVDSVEPSSASSIDNADEALSVDEAPDANDFDDFLSQSPKTLAQTPGADHETPPLDALDIPALENLAGPAPRFTQSQTTVLPVDEPKQPSFMRGARGASLWHRTSVRVVLCLLMLGLLISLLVQIAVQERDRWAAYEPASSPVLEAVCEVVGCSVSPLRNIEAVVIDSSSFTKVRSDVYRLNIALKNNGPVALAPPALELTLTDMQDQSLIRRVLKPQDIGFKVATLAPGAEFSATLPISVKTTASSERISGYRLLAFYP